MPEDEEKKELKPFLSPEFAELGHALIDAFSGNPQTLMDMSIKRHQAEVHCSIIDSPDVVLCMAGVKENVLNLRSIDVVSTSDISDHKLQSVTCPLCLDIIKSCQQ